MRPGSVLILVGTAAWAGADRRLAAARARSAAADALVVMVADSTVPPSAPEMPEVEPYAARPAPLRAIGAWLLSWPLDALSRIKLALARVELRDRAAARERPSARARDGPP